MVLNGSDSSRVIIGADASLVHPHPGIKPTAATFEYKPGVPPGESFKPETIKPENSQIKPPKPNHPNKPLKPENNNHNNHNNNNPFGWIVDWFENFKGSRSPVLENVTNAGEAFLQELNQTQTEQLYELLNHTQYNTSSEYNSSKNRVIVNFNYF